MDFSSIEDFEIEEKRYYELIENPAAQVLTEGNYMYTKGGLAVVRTMIPIMVKKDYYPKILYRKPCVITEEEFTKGVTKEKELEYRGIFMNKEMTLPYGFMQGFTGGVTPMGAGMDLDYSSLLIYHSNLKSHPELWNQLRKRDKIGSEYVIYEFWVRKVIYDIQTKIDDILINKQIETKLKHFKENNYSKDSMMYKDIQRDIERTDDFRMGNYQILVEKYGDIADANSISEWIYNDDLYDKFFDELDVIIEHMDKYGIHTPEEKWIDKFEDDPTINPEFQYNEAKELFDKFYQTYEEV